MADIDNLASMVEDHRHFLWGGMSLMLLAGLVTPPTLLLPLGQLAILVGLLRVSCPEAGPESYLAVGFLCAFIDEDPPESIARGLMIGSSIGGAMVIAYLRLYRQIRADLAGDAAAAAVLDGVE